MKRLDPKAREALRFVKVSDDDLDVDRFPNFLIIGPQRTGTTWLHRNLVKHPQIFMPADKELYYFNNLEHPEHHPKDLPPVSQELRWYLEFFDEPADDVAKKDAECRATFGEPYEVLVRGEATATYAAGMSQAVIEDVLTLNPDLRAVLMIRNPIDRAWSHAKKDLSKNVGKPLDAVTDDEFRGFFGRWYQVQCGHYTHIHDLWQPLLKDDHLFIGEFDLIQRDPAALLCRMFDFLGVRGDAKYVGDLAKKRINPTEPAPIPDRFRPLLEELFGDELQKLSRFGFHW